MAFPLWTAEPFRPGRPRFTLTPHTAHRRPAQVSGAQLGPPRTEGACAGPSGPHPPPTGQGHHWGTCSHTGHCGLNAPSRPPSFDPASTSGLCCGHSPLRHPLCRRRPPQAPRSGRSSPERDGDRWREWRLRPHAEVQAALGSAQTCPTIAARSERPCSQLTPPSGVPVESSAPPVFFQNNPESRQKQADLSRY